MADIDDFLSTENALFNNGAAEPILLIDDSKATRLLIRRILQSLGISDICEFADARSGFLELQRRSYCIVLCDIEMSPINGIQFLSAVRANLEISGTPVVLMTASKNTSYLDKAKQNDANYYILKPFNADTLRRVISDILSLKSAGSASSPAQSKNNDTRRLGKWRQS